MTGREYGVLVAVGPDGVGEGVADLAAAEALRRGTGVELIHVAHSLTRVPTSFERVELVDRELTRVGREALTESAELLRDRLYGKVPLATEVLSGPVVATLVDRAAGADLVVLERRDPDRLERLLTMSVSTRVAAHASAPVMVVPRRWSAAAAEALPVTVGVDDPPAALGQVAPAYEYAELSALPLVVLHALWIAEAYQNVVFADHGRERWLEDAQTLLRLGLAEIAERREVDLTEEVVWQRPADALVEATQRSAVLVLARRTGEHPLRGVLGGTTRTVLRHAACPVLLVDRR